METPGEVLQVRRWGNLKERREGREGRDSKVKGEELRNYERLMDGANSPGGRVTRGASSLSLSLQASSSLD